MNMSSKALYVLVVLSVSLGLLTEGNVTADDKETKNLSIGGVARQGATIKGIVKFKGRQVKRRPIPMAADKHCAAKHANAPPLDERWVFGDNDTLQNAFVWISAGLEEKKFPVPKDKAILDQIGCVYTPHVIGVVVGQELEIRNSDATMHNVNMNSRSNRSFNDAMPLKGMKFTKKFTKPELGMTLRCNVHPWMVAYAHVVEHPYFAVTGKQGTFEIRGLPPGKYTVSVRHEFSRFAPDKSSITLTVGGSDRKEVTFTYAPVSKKRK